MLYTEGNPIISVLEDKEWNTKGPYMTALELDENVNWTKDDRAFVLHMCYEVDNPAFAYSSLGTSGRPWGMRDSPAAISEAGSSTTGFSGLSGLSGLLIGPSGSSSAANPTFREKLIMVLQVPPELANHTDKGLADAWKKYKVYIEAVKKMDELWDAGMLKNVFDKKPVQSDIKNLFKGKTQWHETYQKTFPKLVDYPEMVAWLENQDDKQTDVDLWGIRKASYTFGDLKEWLANDGKGLEYSESSSEEVVLRNKGKKKMVSKEKEKPSAKGNDGRGKGKDKSKGRKIASESKM
jgi:hypothetical protein